VEFLYKITATRMGLVAEGLREDEIAILIPEEWVQSQNLQHD
jgi:hypothetical protein